jgi:hypothetical protein
MPGGGGGSRQRAPVVVGAWGMRAGWVRAVVRICSCARSRSCSQCVIRYRNAERSASAPSHAAIRHCHYCRHHPPLPISTTATTTPPSLPPERRRQTEERGADREASVAALHSIWFALGGSSAVVSARCQLPGVESRSLALMTLMHFLLCSSLSIFSMSWAPSRGLALWLRGHRGG